MFHVTYVSTWFLCGAFFGGEEGYDRLQLRSFAEADLDLSAPAQRLDPDREFERLAHEPRGFVELVWHPALFFGLHLARRAGEVLAHELFRPANGELLGSNPLGELGHLFFGLETQQRPGVSLRELSVRQQGSDPVGQLRQAQSVGHGGPALAQPVGQLLFGEPETLHEGLVGGRCLQGVQILPLQVLHERQLHGLVVPGLPDEDRDPVEPGLLGGAQPPSVERTTSGWSMPTSLIEAASSWIPASGKLRRGWRVLGRIAEVGSSSNFNPPTLSPVAMSAESPRPSPLLPTTQHLLGDGFVRLRPGALGGVERDRQPEAWRLAQPNVSGYDRAEHPLTEEGAYLFGDLVGQVGARVEHGQQ